MQSKIPHHILGELSNEKESTCAGLRSIFFRVWQFASSQDCAV